MFKQTLSLLAAMLLLAACQSLPTPTSEEKQMSNQTPDQAAIAGIVESVGVLADRSEYDALSRLFADEFILDYSSLNDQAASTKSPLQLMSEWASVLPGFDCTRHALSNIKVNVEGAQAVATADVLASHWVDDLFWQVEGHYQYLLARLDGEWKITSMTFNLENEQGTRDVFGPAIVAAADKTQPGNLLSIAERNKATVRRFFNALETEDIPAFVDFFAEDGVQINPYTGGIFPAGAKGRSELLAYWSPVPGNFDGMQFLIDQILATEDPNIIFVRYRGEIKLKGGAGVYKNNYYSTFRFNAEGKIAEYVEIFDPVVAAKGFGLLDQLK